MSDRARDPRTAARLLAAAVAVHFQRVCCQRSEALDAAIADIVRQHGGDVA